MAVKLGDRVNITKINGHTITPQNSQVVEINAKSFVVDPPVKVEFNSLYGAGFTLEHKFIALDNPEVDEYEIVRVGSEDSEG